MRHPFTRAERRYAWFIARRRYRVRLAHNALNLHPEQKLYWNRGGKQCKAHGNRCAHSLIARQDRRRINKRLRSGIEIAALSEYEEIPPPDTLRPVSSGEPERISQ